MKLQEALTQLKSEEKRKFEQSLDLIINLKNIDLKRDQVNIVITLPHKVKEKKVCAFLTQGSKIIDTVTPAEFKKYKDKKSLKTLVKNYDYFIAVSQLMPSIATTFGKVLGPTGKMPSPQLGIINDENENTIKTVLDKISKSIKVRIKEASFKFSIGKENMEEEKIMENIKTSYNSIENALPKKKENIRSVMLKLTMSKPVKLEI